jgi:hypothetical protein
VHEARSTWLGPKDVVHFALSWEMGGTCGFEHGKVMESWDVGNELTI